MDYLTLTADQLAAMDADEFAMLPLEDTSSSSSGSSFSSTSSDSSWSSASSGSSSSSSSESSWSSQSSYSSSSSSSEEFSSSSEERRPMPSNMAQTQPPSFWLSGGGQFRGASFGFALPIDDVVSRTTAVPHIRFPAVLHLESPYSNSEIRYTVNGKSPTPTSHLYAGPIGFSPNAAREKTTVTARIYDKRNANVKGKIIRLQFRVLPDC